MQEWVDNIIETIRKEVVSYLGGYGPSADIAKDMAARLENFSHAVTPEKGKSAAGKLLKITEFVDLPPTLLSQLQQTASALHSAET